MKLFKKAKKGFTLVELIVVIAIVAILAAVSVAGYYGFIESAKQSRADQEAAQAKLVLQAAFTPMGEVVVEEDDPATTEVVETVTYEFAWSEEGIECAKYVLEENVLAAFNKVLQDKGGFDSGKYSLETVVFYNAAGHTSTSGTGTDEVTFYNLIKSVNYKVTESQKTSTIKFAA